MRGTSVYLILVPLSDLDQLGKGSNLLPQLLAVREKRLRVVVDLKRLCLFARQTIDIGSRRGPERQSYTKDSGARLPQGNMHGLHLTLSYCCSSS